MNSQQQPSVNRHEPRNAALKLLVKGFKPMEHHLLNGAVKLSQRRLPQIELARLGKA